MAYFSHCRNGLTFGATMFLMITFCFRKPATNCSTEYMLGTNTTHQQRGPSYHSGQHVFTLPEFICLKHEKEGREEGSMEGRKDRKQENCSLLMSDTTFLKGREKILHSVCSHGTARPSGNSKFYIGLIVSK